MNASASLTKNGVGLLSILPPHPHMVASSPIHPGLVSPDSQPANGKHSMVPEQQSNLLHRAKDHSLIVPRPQGYAVAVTASAPTTTTPLRLNKFVRRLHDMLVMEKNSGIVEWRRGLLVIYSTDAFSKKTLPRYFNTRNFKTFRRQLNYYGFSHVRSFSATGNSTTALWINQDLAQNEANDDVSAVLKLRRVEPNEAAKTVEGRRHRKEMALHTVEEDIGLDAKKLQLDQIRSMAIRGEEEGGTVKGLAPPATIPSKTTRNIEVPRIVSVPSNFLDDSSDSHSDPEGACGNIKSSLYSLNHVENNTAAANMLLMLAKSS